MTIQITNTDTGLDFYVDGVKIITLSKGETTVNVPISEWPQPICEIFSTMLYADHAFDEACKK